MRIGQFMEALGYRDGIEGVFLPDASLLEKIRSEECDASVAGGIMRYDPVGMRECMSMDAVVLLRCGNGFAYPSFLRMEMVDDAGIVIGHNIKPEDKSLYEGRDDIIWISDSFVMYAERVSHHDASILLYSHEYDVSEICDGVVAKIYSPTMTSCAVIDEVYGKSGLGVCTAILGVNGLNTADESEEIAYGSCCGEPILQRSDA